MSANLRFEVMLVAFLAIIVLCAKPLGLYIAGVMDGAAGEGGVAGIRGAANFARRAGGRIEAFIYRLCGIDPGEEMPWQRYAIGLLGFNLVGALVLYALQRLQGWLPLNPQHLAAVSADSSFNTAVSFVTNTDWQGYSGESTLGYLVQMSGLAVQNFMSAATGIAVAIALVRGFVRHSAATIGNFWVDLTRATLYLLLPLATLLALVLASQGVIQNLDGYRDATTIERLTYQNPKTDAAGNPLKDAAGTPLTETATTHTQTLPMGPVASQEAIKELGTNGGGFFNANSAHPYENPTPFTNLLEMLAILVIPFALTYTFGRMVGDTRQGWALMAAMGVLFVVLVQVAYQSEQHGNPLVARAATLPGGGGAAAGEPVGTGATAIGSSGGDATGGGASRAVPFAVDHAAADGQSGGNMEGKETRFGIAASALFVAATTATSCGAVNTMHDSLMPLGGFVPLFLIQLGELAPGGVGTGLYTVLIFAILGVFIAGLMIGLTTPFIVLIGTTVGVLTSAGVAGVANPGAHGFSEILYAFSSAANNNGSAFAGLSANTVFYNVSTALAMWFGRFWPIVAALAIAGSLAAKKRVPVTQGTMPTHGPLFVSLLLGSILLIGVLTYVPALALGPVVEHYQLQAAR